MTFHVSWLENQYPVWVRNCLFQRLYRKTKTFLYSDWTDATHIVFGFDQLRSLECPELILVLIGKATEELQEESKELPLVGIVKVGIPLAAV